MKKSNIINNILKEAEKERSNLKHPYVGSEHLLLVILKNKNNISEYLKKYKITYNSFKKELVNVVGNATKDYNVNLYTPLLRKIINKYKNNIDIDSDLYEELFIYMLDEGEGIAIRILLRMNIDLDEIYLDLKEKQKLKQMVEANKIGILLNNKINLEESIIGRDKEIEKMILCLTRKKKCNPLLIGPAGVGKTAVVEELVRRIKKGLVPDNLKDKKIYLLEMGSLISGTKYRGEFEERLNKIIKEILTDKNTIIFIDEIHTMVGAGGADGAINASDILKPYLARGDIKCIGATTPNEYNISILKDKALARRFDVINISEPKKEEMYNLLLHIKKEYEKFHNIKIPKKIIKRIIDLSDYYMKNIVNPDKSIDLLDSSCSYAKIYNHDTLIEEDIINTIYYKTNNKLIKRKEFINNIMNNLKDKINIKNLKTIVDSFKIIDNKPLSFLINYEELFNIIKEELGSINIIDIDLNCINYSLYNSSLYTDKTLNESVFKEIIEKPYSLILFKGINKANKYLLDEIANINKKGYISFKNNEKLYLNNSIIICLENNNDLYKSGFNNTLKTNILPDKFILSFTKDLRNIKINKIRT